MDYFNITSSTQVDDAALEAQLATWISATTGLSANMVQPKWQANPVTPPTADENWCDFGLQSISVEGYPCTQLLETSYHYSQLENLELLCTFYGPNAQSFIQIFRDNIMLPANNSVLQKNINLSFRQASKIIALPEQVNNAWIRRYDIIVVLNRTAERTYAITNIDSAAAEIRSN